MRKIALTIIASTTICIPAFAQFGFGAQGNGIYGIPAVLVNDKYYNINPAPQFGYGLSMFYNIHQGMFRISADAGYASAAVATYSKPDSVNTQAKIWGYNISPEFQYAFKGNFDNKGTVWYVLAGFDMNFYRYWANGGNVVWEFDKYGYPMFDPHTAMPVYINSYYAYAKSYTGFTPNIGIGGEWGIITNFHLFGQLKYSIGSKPSFNDIDQFGFTQESMPKSYNPSYFSLNIGIRFWPDPKVWK